MGRTRKSIVDALKAKGILPAYVGVGKTRNQVLERATRKLQLGELRLSKYTLAQRRELGTVSRELVGKRPIAGFEELSKQLVAWRDRETTLAKKKHPEAGTPEAYKGTDPIATLRRAIKKTDGGVRVFYAGGGSPFEQRWTTDGFIRFVSLPQYKRKWRKVFGGGKFYFAVPNEQGGLPSGARPARFTRPK
jgi:hypothetical protein